MKRFTRFTSLLTLSALLALFPNSNTLKVSADTPTAYSIAYVDEKDDWRYQEGGDFDSDKDHYDLEDLEEEMKAGDYIVIYGNSTEGDTIDIPAYVGNLTVIGSASFIIVNTPGINEFHATFDAVVAVNGDIQNAYLYDNVRVTFNNNVGTLDINASDDSGVVTNCVGTVGHAIHHYEDTVYFDIYNVAADKFVVDEGELETESKYYSTTAVAAPAPAPVAPAQTTNSSQTASDEYDDVPKTGESPIIFLLLGIALVSLAGSRLLKRA